MSVLDFSDLKGKVTVMTGGTGVIGRALAEALAASGAKLALAGRDKAKADAIAAEVVAKVGGTVVGLALDVTDRPSLEAARAEVNRLWGPVDILINGAGGNKPTATTALETMVSADPADRAKSFFGLDTAAVDEVFKLNFQGTLVPTQVFAQDMVGRGGVVLNISSMAALRPLTKVPGYAASKAAVDNLTKWLATHLAPQGIRVNALAPGFFLTEQNRFIMIDEKTGELSPRAKKVVAATPMARLGEVEELQGATLFLVSQMSKFMTGVVLPVDGGFSAYSGV